VTAGLRGVRWLALLADRTAVWAVIEAPHIRASWSPSFSPPARSARRAARHRRADGVRSRRTAGGLVPSARRTSRPTRTTRTSGCHVGGGPRASSGTRSEHARWSPDGGRLLIVRGDNSGYDLSGGDAPAHQAERRRQGRLLARHRFAAFTSEVYPQCRGNDDCNKGAREAERRPGSTPASSTTCSRATGRSGRKASAPTSSSPPAAGPARDVTRSTRLAQLPPGRRRRLPLHARGQAVVSSKPRSWAGAPAAISG
jgi:hypothetical protein